MKRALDDAAIGMAANDYVWHPQHAHRIFDGGRNSAERIGIRRHNVADHAADEQLAWLGLGEQARVDAGIGAGDEERLGPLTQGELFEEILMLRINIPLESGDAPQEFFDRHILR